MHGDWGLGIGPNPQSPIFFIKFLNKFYIYKIILINNLNKLQLIIINL